MEGLCILLIGVITIILVSFIMLTPTSDDENMVIYDTMLVGEHYSKGEDYYIKGIIDTSHCGNVMERSYGMGVREFKVSYNVFSYTFQTSRISISYTCKKGQISDISWRTT